MRKIVLLVMALSFVVFANLVSAATELDGNYISRDNKNEHIILGKDGKFVLKQQKKPYDMEHPYVTIEGSYKTDGEAVTLNLPDGGEATGKVQDGVFIDSQEKYWIKEGVQQNVDLKILPRKRFRY